MREGRLVVGQILFAVAAFYDDGDNPVAEDTETKRVATRDEARKLAKQMIEEGEHRRRSAKGGFWYASIEPGRYTREIAPGRVDKDSWTPELELHGETIL